MLGFCQHCQTLRTITRLPSRNIEGEINYGAIEHAEPDRHRGCGGVVHWVTLESGEDVRTCEQCERVVDDVVPGAARCPGIRKPIR